MVKYQINIYQEIWYVEIYCDKNMVSCSIFIFNFVQILSTKSLWIIKFCVCVCFEYGVCFVKCMSKNCLTRYHSKTFVILSVTLQNCLCIWFRFSLHNICILWSNSKRCVWYTFVEMTEMPYSFFSKHLVARIALL